MAISMSKINVFINGLYPGYGTLENSDPGSTVLLFTGENPEINILLKGKADSNGILEGEIPVKYLYSKIMLRIRKSGFIPIENEIEVKPYGVFFTPKLVLDGVYIDDNGVELSWNSDQIYAESSDILKDKIKNFRYKNTFEKILFYLISISLTAVGFVVNPILGVFIAIVAFVFSELVTPYAIGLKKIGINS